MKRDATGIPARVKRLHRDDEGAVLMLMLAGVLISLMAALVLYDAGIAASDKMSTQVAADTSAFSASVVKARSMNLVSVANTNKRVIYGISTSYTAAYLALLESEAAFAARCAFTDLSSCLKAIRGGIQITLETVEMLATNIPQMWATSRTEVDHLETYQDYMITITPWWAWIEALMRSRVNDGTFAATWPPPGDVSAIFDKVTQVLQGLDFVFGGTLSTYIPSHSSANDELPLTRREKQSLTSGLPGVGGLVGGLEANVKYCLGYTFSMDHLMLFAEHYMKSDSSIGISRDPQTIALYAVTMLAQVPCVVAYGLLGDNVFDYRISGSPAIPNPVADAKNPGDDWLQATSMTSFSYKARAGRNDDDGGRKKFGYMKQDYDSILKPFMQNDGQLSMARSEIVWDNSSLTSAAMSFAVPSLQDIGFVDTLMNRPDMWSPGWTAKLRPMTLPGEKHGATVVLRGSGDDIGLSEMVIDVLPFLLFAGVVGLIDGDTSMKSMAEDMFFFARSAQSFNAETMEGISK